MEVSLSLLVLVLWRPAHGRHPVHKLGPWKHGSGKDWCCTSRFELFTVGNTDLVQLLTWIRHWHCWTCHPWGWPQWTASAGRKDEYKNNNGHNGNRNMYLEVVFQHLPNVLSVGKVKGRVNLKQHMLRAYGRENIARMAWPKFRSWTEILKNGWMLNVTSSRMYKGAGLKRRRARMRESATWRMKMIGILNSILHYKILQRYLKYITRERCPPESSLKESFHFPPKATCSKDWSYRA